MNIIDKIHNKNSFIDVSKEIEENYKDILKLYHEKTDILTLNYAEYDINKLYNNFKNDKSLTNFILYLHHKIYSFIEVDNFRTLKSKEEMIHMEEDKEYYVNIVDNYDKQTMFIAFLLLFALESKFNKHLMIGIDYEYNTGKKEIALAQYCFEHYQDMRNIIYLFYPPSLTEIQMKILLELIMANTEIRKILHGSDALDCYYLYEILMFKNKELIIPFTKSLVDTRFICEFLKFQQGDELNTKCNIYDALIFFDVVSKEKRDELEEINNSMLPQDRIWKINLIHRDPSQVAYAYYDCLFLKHLYNRMIKIVIKDKPIDEQASLIYVYRHVIFESTQLVYLEKNLITDMLNSEKLETDAINNYFIDTKKNKHMIINNIYKIVEEKGMVLKSINFNIYDLLKVNYFKKQINIILKKFIFSHLTKNYKVFEKVDKQYNKILTNDKIFNYLKEYKFTALEKILKEYETVIGDYLNKYI